jgi:hypothetical protein
LFLLLLFLHLLLLAFFLVFLATLISHAGSFSAIMSHVAIETEPPKERFSLNVSARV